MGKILLKGQSFKGSQVSAERMFLFFCFLFIFSLLLGCSSAIVRKDKDSTISGFKSKFIDDSSLMEVHSIAVAQVNLENDLEGVVSEGELTEQLLNSMRKRWGEQAVKDGESEVDAMLRTEITSLSGRNKRATTSGVGATVSCRYSLEKLPGREVIWQATYTFSDQPLSENLFRMSERVEGGGIGWKNSSELLQSSFEEVAKALSVERERIFLR